MSDNQAYIVMSELCEKGTPWRQKLLFFFRKSNEHKNLAYTWRIYLPLSFPASLRDRERERHVWTDHAQQCRQDCV